MVNGDSEEEDIARESLGGSIDSLLKSGGINIWGQHKP